MSSQKMPWFRAYTEMLDDEKLGLLAFEDRWHFIALLCLKGKGILDSEPDTEMLWRKAALKMGLTVAELEKVVSRLARMKLIDKSTLQPLAWDDRQMKSDTDPTAVERKRKQREREKLAKHTRNAIDFDVTETVTAHVTEPSRVTCHDVTRTEEDTDTDKEDSYESLSPGFPDDDAGEPENQSEAADQADQPATKPSLPACPHLELLDIFAEQLPELPQPKPELWEGQRAKALASRWKWCLTAKKRSGARYATTKAEALDFFRRYFGYVAKSDFLTGRDGRWAGCDLAWLVKADNFAKVLQGNYENRQQEATA